MVQTWKSYQPAMDLAAAVRGFANADGKVPANKVIDVLRVAGLTIYEQTIKKDSPSEAALILQELGDGPYTVEQLQEWYTANSSNYVREKHEVEKVLDNMTQLVEGKNHKVHLDQLKHLMSTFCNKISKEDFDKIVPKGSVKEEKDGLVSMDELISHLGSVQVQKGWV